MPPDKLRSNQISANRSRDIVAVLEIHLRHNGIAVFVDSIVCQFLLVNCDKVCAVVFFIKLFTSSL